MKLFKTRPEAKYVDFEYLYKKSTYFDSACQTLRPEQVIEKVTEYFQKYNACGGRVKYDWGVKVDEQVAETRKLILSFLNKSNSEYVVAFTENTSYGINLVLSQLPASFQKVITSEIEHNSVFLPTMEVAKRLNIPRLVLPRLSDGSLSYKPEDLSGAIIVLNNMSNFDGQKLLNISDIVRDAHQSGGIVLIDAAQGMIHGRKLLQESDWDALFFSGHKFYGPSLGVIVIKKSLLKNLDIKLVGGGTVEEVSADSYKLVSADEDLSARLEIGLQNFSGILGLNASLKWQEKYKPEGMGQDSHQAMLADLLFKGLSEIPTLKVINSKPSPVISFYSEKVDGHRLAIFLSEQNIMLRSGYFCCHHYLKNVKKYPPLVRVSLGLHNTKTEVENFLNILKAILANS